MSEAALDVSRPARGAYAKSQRTRESLLDSAFEVFSESGYRAGSMRDIAARVGMSEAGLLHHFPNKSALLAAVLDKRDGDNNGTIPLGDVAGVRTLTALIDVAAASADQPGVVELFCMLSAEATTPDHPAHAYFIDRYESIRRDLTAAFASIERDGLLMPGVSPRQAAVATIAMWDGLQVQWLLNRDVVDVSAGLRTFFATIVDAEI